MVVAEFLQKLTCREDPAADLLDEARPGPPQGTERGTEILNWYDPEDVHEFQAAIELAAAAARLTLAMPTNSASTCAHRPRILINTHPHDQSEQ
jgi:hypothetical protein